VSAGEDVPVEIELLLPAHPRSMRDKR